MNTALPIRITGVMIRQASEVQMAFCTDLKAAVKNSVAWILGCSLEKVKILMPRFLSREQ